MGYFVGAERALAKEVVELNVNCDNAYQLCTAIPAEVATFMTTTNGTIVPSVPFELGIPPPAPMGLKGAPKKRGEIEWNWQKRSIC